MGSQKITQQNSSAIKQVNKMKEVSFAVAIALLLLSSGCGSSYNIRVIDGAPKEVYLTFSKGADVKVGDIFVLYRTQESSSMGGQQAGHAGHGGHGGGGQLSVKQEVGRVQVIRIVGETHASVKVLSGIVEDGLKAEKGE